MKLIEMQVENFRSLSGESVKVSFEGSDIIFLLGQNNAGKSSLLAAYEYLVTPKQKADRSDFTGFTPKSPIRITATFRKEAADDEPFTSKGFNKWVDKDGLIRFRRVWEAPDTEGKKQTYSPEDGDFVDNGFGGLESHFAKHAPTPIRVPAMPTMNDLTKWLTEVVKKLSLKQLHSSEASAYQDLVNKLTILRDKAANNQALLDITQKANQHFQLVFPTLKLNISPLPANDIDLSKLLEKDFSVSVSDLSLSGTTPPVETQGHGVIRQAMFNLLCLMKDGSASSHSRLATEKTHLILFEEPELYLHPTRVRLLRDTLYSLCGNSNFQVLCASHSPSLIDISRPHTSLVRVARSPQGSTSVFQVGADLFASSEEQRERVLMINRFNPFICEAFFADIVCIVEGDTEAIVVRDLLGTTYPASEIFVLNAGSKFNIPFFQEILTHFGIQHHVIHDADSRWCYNHDGSRKLKKSGEPMRNAAWTLNDQIWSLVVRARAHSPDLARRSVFIRNFEHAHGYRHDSELGKPFTAYRFARTLGSGATPVERFVKEMIDPSVRPQHDYSPAYLEQHVIEPDEETLAAG